MDPLLLIVIIILVLWLAGFGFHVGGNLIHLLLVVLIIVLLVRYLGGRRTL